MKKIYLLLFFVFTIFYGSAQSIHFLGETDGNISLSCEVLSWDHVTVSTGEGEAWIPVTHDATPMLRAGCPDVPKITEALLVDDQAEMQINVLSSHYTEYQDVLIAPSKGNLLRNIDPATVPYVFGEAYNTNEFFPGDLAKLGNAYIQGHTRGQAIQFFPFQYNPVTQVLRVYDHIDVVVVKTDATGENVISSSASKQVNLVYDEMYKDHYLNYEANADRYDEVGEIGNMLVITHADYIDELAPWVQWKKEKGIPVEVVDVATIIAEAGNDITNIDGYVSDYYNDNGLTYLVLVGDEDQIPTLLVNNSGGQGYCDACYGYISGNDHFSEIFIGRLIVHEEDELPPVIAKILEYEKTPYMASDWFSVAVGIGSNEGDGFGDDGQADWEHQNGLKEELLDFTYTEVWELYDGSHTASSPTGGETADAAGSPPASSLSTIINNGCSLINYTGHGSHNSIVTSSFTNTNINALTNQNKYPYFIIVGCCVGDFDDDDASGETFGEVWLKTLDGTDPAGGIGGAFSSVYQSWAPPMEGQDEMNKVIVETSQVQNTRHTLGSIHVHGCGSMNDEYGGGGDDMTDTWHLFGDPTVQLRTAYPTSLTVTHDDIIFLGMDNLTVSSTTEGAMVGLSVDGELLATGIIEGGSVNLTFPAIIIPTTILVTVTSFNTLPYQGNIDVIVANGPYVVDNATIIDDSNGNNNDLADYDESILLDVALENVGIETAFGVNATLTTEDTNVTITDNYHYYGDIIAGGIPMAEDGFAFDVIDGVEDQHNVLFTLIITDANENTWTMDFTVLLNAPVLSCDIQMSIDDSDGNNNGKIDSGETVTVSVPVNNIGHASSVAAIANLSTTSSYLTITDSDVNIGTISDGASQTAEFTVVADADIPDGTIAEFTFDAVAGMYTTTCDYETSLDIIMEDWESGTVTTFPWELAGDADWFITNTDPYEGLHCLQSGAISNGDNTILKLVLNVLEAGDVTFSSRVSSEASYDFLTFRIDNTEMDSWSGEVPWTEHTYALGTGTHTLRWTYEKDAFCCIEGDDAAWVDNITLPPNETISSVEENKTDVSSLDIFPNPATESAFLAFSMNSPGNVSVTVFDALGNIVRSLESGILSTGEQKYRLDTRDLAPGLYNIRLVTSQGVFTAKLMKK